MAIEAKPRVQKQDVPANEIQSDVKPKPMYDYGDKTKSVYNPTGTAELPESEFDEDEAVQMKVPGTLNGKPVDTWKPFTIRKADYDSKLGVWTYQLNKNGEKYKGGQYFPEKALKALESNEP